MSEIGNLGTFSIKSNQATLQQLRHIEVGISHLLNFMADAELPTEAWETVRIITDTLDDAIYDCIKFPSDIHLHTDDTYIPKTAENTGNR